MDAVIALHVDSIVPTGEIEIREGRTRQIREMFLRAGHPVQRLRRIAIGGLKDPRLPRGSYRELSRSELDRLWKVSGGPEKK